VRTFVLITVLALTAPAQADAQVAKPSINEQRSDADTLLDEWVRAQNEGDFAAYRALYAPQFHGVRRSADRIARFDLDGWMADRARMFKNPMHVAIGDKPNDTRFIPGTKTARVVFTQTWTSKTYRDVGRKELVLRRVGDHFLIVHEELFDSTLGAAKEHPLGSFMFVVEGRLVLSDDVKDEWAAGTPKTIHAGPAALVRMQRPVRMHRLPPALAAWPGKVVELFDEHGARCEATVGPLELVARSSAPEAFDRAGELWDASPHLLVARLDTKTPCKNAGWARLASLPPPTVIAAEPASPALQKEAVTHFRADPSYAELQADYASYRGKKTKKQWDTAMTDGPVVVSIPLPAGERLVSVTVSGDLGKDCEDTDAFEGHLWVLWRVNAAGQWTRANRPNAWLSLVPAALVDIDENGVPALWFHDAANFGDTNGFGQPEQLDIGLVRQLGGLYDDVAGLPLWAAICPC
jgi:hypothetical protein